MKDRFQNLEKNTRRPGIEEVSHCFQQQKSSPYREILYPSDFF